MAWLRMSRWKLRASLRSCRTAWDSEIDSSTNAMASTMYAIDIVVGARRTVEQLGDAVPHGNRRPDHEQPHRRQQRPDVGLSSVAERSQRVGRTLRLRRLAIIRRSWFPASAQECAASAVIEVDPDSTEAAVLATAIAALTPNAISTVRTLPALSSTPLGRVDICLLYSSVPLLCWA